jgi:hypothetical protein
MTTGSEIDLNIGHALLQDVQGALVMLELEATGVDRVHTTAAAQPRQWHQPPGAHAAIRKIRRTLVGSASHTAAAGIRMPAVFGSKLTDRLPQWVNAKDIIREMLRGTGKTSSTSVLPLSFADPSDCDGLQVGDTTRIPGIARMLTAGEWIESPIDDTDTPTTLRHTLSERQIAILLDGSAINGAVISDPRRDCMRPCWCATAGVTACR